MIKRDYFVSVRKHHDDGSGSYSYYYAHFTRTSWLPQSELAFRDIIEEITNDMSKKPGTKIEVIAFNRC